jgi:hypothetical protein
MRVAEHAVVRTAMAALREMPGVHFARGWSSMMKKMVKMPPSSTRLAIDVMISTSHSVGDSTQCRLYSGGSEAGEDGKLGRPSSVRETSSSGSDLGRVGSIFLTLTKCIR